MTPFKGPERTQIRVHPADFQRGDMLDTYTVVGYWGERWRWGRVVAEVSVLDQDGRQTLLELAPSDTWYVSRRSPMRAGEG